MKLEGVRVRVAKGDVEEFKQSILWKDIKRELISWKKGFDLERASIVDNASKDNPSTATVLMHLGDINGRIKAVDYMLSIPDVFIQIIESENEKAGEETITNEPREDKDGY